METALRTVPTLTAEEGNALFVQQALLGTARPELVWARAKELPAHDKLSVPLRVLAAEHRAKAALEFLYLPDGVRERTVLRQGRRASGRLWDPALNEGFALVHSEAGQEVWTRMLKALPVLANVTPTDKESDKKRKKALKDLVPQSAHAGDWVVYALMLQQLSAFQLPTPEMEEVARMLRRGSPLALLMELGRDIPGTDFVTPMTALVQAKSVRVLECVEQSLLDAWRTSLAATWKQRLTAEMVIARWTSAAELLNALFDALDRAARLDLARVMMRFARALVNEVLEGKGVDVRTTRIGSIPGVYSLREREAVCKAMLGVLASCSKLVKAYGVMGAERYGDDRYEEAQVYLRDAAQWLQPIRGRIDELQRGLSGTIG